MIIANNLVKKYKLADQEEINALDELTLFLPDKGFIAIYGASGCGKSTLLNILGGLDQADSGTLIVNGRNTNKFSKKDWDSYRNQQVGFIFQNYYLLPHLTVHDNIAITLQMSKQTQDLDKKVKDALNQVEMGKYSRRYPRQLSGGQQQRVAIARALISNPAIILADEPTGALDEKSSKIVMENLQKISKEHLVVMVTHNERMAKQYADRMIEISYGKIISDDIIQPETDDIENLNPLLKVHLPFKSSFIWSCRNVVKKKGRSIPIAIASAIGLAAAGVVLSMTGGVNDYVAQAQKEAIRDYPVYVTCYPSKSAESNKDNLIRDPDLTDIIIEKSDYNAQEHYITMEDDFMKYMYNGLVAGEDYAHVYSNQAIKFNLFTEEIPGSYLKINTSSYTTCIAPTVDTYKFIKEQYEVLAGHLPESSNDLTIVVDEYNRIDLYALQQMGFDTSGDRIKSEDIIGKKEYRVVSNDDYYIETTTSVPIVNDEGNIENVTRNTFGVVANSKYADLYNTKAFKSLKITGIIRAAKESQNPIYSNILLFHPDLLTEIKANNENSKIVKAQLENTEWDVRTGLNYETTITSGYELLPGYLHENRLVDIGGKERTTALYYYTDNFEQRLKIIDYADKYEVDDESGIIIRTRDYLEQVTSAFASVVKTFSTILLAFALVSVFVSAILTAILTYISVVERKREIGLLRSLGARRRDISYMFITEALIIGVVAGALGIGLCYGLAPIASKIVVKLIAMANTGLLTPSASQFSHIQTWLIPILFIGAIVVGVVSSLIPAIIAGRKKPADALKE